MPARRRCSPTSSAWWPVIAYCGSPLLVAWIVVVAVFWSVTEAIGLLLALLPSVLVAVVLARVTAGRPRGHAVFVPAEERRIAEVLAKLVALVVFGVSIGSVNAFSRLPLFASGYSLVLATLIGVAAWTLAADVLMVVWVGERREAPND